MSDEFVSGQPSPQRDVNGYQLDVNGVLAGNVIERPDEVLLFLSRTGKVNEDMAYIAFDVASARLLAKTVSNICDMIEARHAPE